jgi:hypothetical protein
MIADLLPEEKRADGFGIMRVIGNLAWVIGPSIGGFLAAKSYLILFILDAVMSLTTAVIVYLLIPETLPQSAEGQRSQSVLDTLVGYRLVLKDRLYVAFALASMLMLLAYQQLYSTLSVFLRDVHAIPEQGYGFLDERECGGGGAASVLVYPEDPTLSAHADDGAGVTVLPDRFLHVWLCLGLPALFVCDLHCHGG